MAGSELLRKLRAAGLRLSIAGYSLFWLRTCIKRVTLYHGEKLTRRYLQRNPGHQSTAISIRSFRPDINAEKFRSTRTSTKRKQETSGYNQHDSTVFYDMGSARHDLSGSASMPIPNQPKTISNRVLKSQINAAKHAKLKKTTKKAV